MKVRLPKYKDNRLKLLARYQGVSLNKSFEKSSTAVLAEFDVETRFRLRADRGSTERGLRILAKLDRAT